MKTIQFGYHLTLDLYGCPKDLLSSMSHCYKVIDELPSILGMKKLTLPYLVFADSNEKEGGKDPGGVTGYLTIAESHVSIHTFPKRGFVSLDVYSCKEFDYDTASNYLISKFQSVDVEMHKIDRGTRYPIENIYD